jgi:8-hydroxy-5-deazaflavin:NADPH oxidoreductase
MNVTILGAGKMGRAIGTRLAAGGHTITLVDRNPENAEKVAAEIRASVKSDPKVYTDTFETVQPGDVVILAVWYGVNLELVKKLGTKLAGKVVVDIANPLNSTYDGLATTPDSSSAEDVAKAAAPGTRVVKAFNTTFAGTLMTGQVAGQALDVFIAGDDPEARQMVAQLVMDGGMRPVDTGPLSRSRQIEGMQLIQILVQGSLGTNWGSSIKIIG